MRFISIRKRFENATWLIIIAILSMTHYSVIIMFLNIFKKKIKSYIVTTIEIYLT